MRFIFALALALSFLLSASCRADEIPAVAPHHHHKPQPPSGPSEVHNSHSDVEKSGGFTFEQQDLTAEYPYPKRDDLPDAPSTVEVDIAYPKIISPTRNRDVDAWNRIHYRTAPSTADCDEDDRYSIGYVTEDFISLEREDASTCPGAAHPWANIYMDNRLISADRQLAPCDIFDHGHPWEGALRDLAWAELKKEFKLHPNESNLRREVTDPNTWGFDQHGLIIQFDLNLFGFAGGAPRVTIPWEKLKPYLTAHPAFRLPFQLPAPATAPTGK